jgi:predicted molibdopterin-dependent oxidoreductase YjgC
LGGARIGVRRISRGEDDALLIRADKGGNSKGAAWILGDAATEEKVLEAAARGEVDTLLITGDPLDPGDTAALVPAVRSRVASVVFAGPFVSGAALEADVLLPAAAWAEEDGTVVNFEGRVQRVRRCHLPRGEGRPGWRVACDLALAAGGKMPEWSSPDEVLVALEASSKPFEGLDAAAIGLLGVSRG